MVCRLAYLCDAGPINARDRRVLLEDRLRRVGVLDEWDVKATPSGNAPLVRELRSDLDALVRDHALLAQAT